MTTDSGNIIAEIKAAETEAARVVHEAEEARRRKVAEAEQAAARKLVEVRARLVQEHAAAVSRAREQAQKELADGAREAESLARKATEVPRDRFDRAVEKVVQALRKQWQ